MWVVPTLILQAAGENIIQFQVLQEYRFSTRRSKQEGTWWNRSKSGRQNHWDYDTEKTKRATSNSCKSMFVDERLIQWGYICGIYLSYWPLATTTIRPGQWWKIVNLKREVTSTDFGSSIQAKTSTSNTKQFDPRVRKWSSARTALNLLEVANSWSLHNTDNIWMKQALAKITNVTICHFPRNARK
jgi:hypothetical protein